MYILNILALVLLSVVAVKYPTWIADGYLDNLYSIIMVGIVAYGGIAANIWYLYKVYYKKNK